MATYTRNQRRRKLFIRQRLMGLGLIAISVFLICFAFVGQTMKEHDCTAILLTFPLGLVLLFGKKNWIV